MTQVVFIQHYVPEYRVSFYENLKRELASRHIEFILAHGSPWGVDVERSDRRKLDGVVELQQRVWRLGGRHLVYRKLGTLANHCDGLVLLQSMHSLENYRMLLRRGGPPIALWGHGHTHTAGHSAALRASKRLLTNRADWFFAYTDTGAKQVAAGGFPEHRVTVVKNTIDTTSLITARDRISNAQISALRSDWDLTPGRTGLYIGGLDSSKRLPFLVEAVRLIERKLPGFRLLIAGDGPEKEYVMKEASVTPSLIWTGGRASEAKKALLGAVADVMLMPGRVGLCAVDSFALGTPIVTCNWPYHAPEFSYLEDGRNATVVDGGTQEYADTVCQLLNSPSYLDAMKSQCRAEAATYKVEGMARRFADGVQDFLRSPGREPELN